MQVEETEPGSNPDVEGWREQKASLFALDRYVCQVIADGDSVIGYADGIVTYEPARRAVQFIGTTIYISPDWRGAALSLPMIESLIQECREFGVTEYVTHGTPSQHFYEKVTGNKMEDYMVMRLGKL